LPVDFVAPLEAIAIETEADAANDLYSEGGPSRLRIWGFVGKPGLSRSTREDQHLFVNRRPVENRGLNFALLEGYHTALMKGRYPVCCLFLEIDPGAVDVNIHPAKREVKFHNERAVRQKVSEAVRDVLLGYHSARALGSPSKSPSVAATSPENRPSVEEPTISLLPKFPDTSQFQQSKPLAPTPKIEAVPGFRPPAPQAARKTPAESSPSSDPTPSPPRNIEVRSTAGGDPQPLLNVPLRLAGVIGKLYVVLESDRGLVLLDQHAAHERILFEQMLDRMEKQGNAPSQRLLLPETIELSTRDSQFVRELLPTLTRLGVGLNEFGERTFLLDALPPFVKVTDSRRFVLELVDQLKAAGQEVNSMRLGEHTVAKTVCRHAVKANDPLAGPELENLVNDLRHCAMPYTCPHGRPTLIEMNYRELEKKFGRQQ
jgi:DNA mismatch repair protein MutL